MLVREIMTSPAISVRDDDDLDVVLGLMARHRVTALPVLNAGAEVVGILSEVDLLRRVVMPDRRAHLKPVRDAEPLNVLVREIMTPDPKTAAESDDVSDLVPLFSQGLKSLPVVHGTELVGVVSRSDVIRALWRPDEELTKAVQDALAENGFAGWGVQVNQGLVEVTGPSGPREASIADAVARSVLGVRRVRVDAG